MASPRTLLPAIPVVLFAAVTTARAMLLSIDHPRFGPGSITRDTATGLDWLDLTASMNRTFDDVSSQFGVGGDFEGFRYATEGDLNTVFFSSAGLRAHEDSEVIFDFTRGPVPQWSETQLAFNAFQRAVGRAEVRVGFQDHFSSDGFYDDSTAGRVGVAILESNGEFATTDIYIRPDIYPPDILPPLAPDCFEGWCPWVAGSWLVRNAPPPPPIEAGLVAYWPLDQHTAFDDVWDGFDGEERGSAPIQFGPGKFGEGIVLSGDDQYVEITGGPADGLDFVDSPMSVSAWFRVDAFDTSWQALIAKGEQDGWRIHRRGDEDGMAFTAGEPDTPSSGVRVDDGEIHHVVAVSVDSALADNVKRLYIDGQLAAEGARDPIGIPNTNNRVRIGDNPSTSNREWEGLIDDVAIWNRALSDDDVTAIYSSGRSIGDLIEPPADQNTVLSGTLGTFASSDELDTEGDFAYAINVGGPGDLKVGDATFADGSEAGMAAGTSPGATITDANEIPDWHTAADYGDANLEEVMRSIRWNTPPGLEVHLEVDPEQTYKLQLLFAESCCDRGFDITVEDELLVDNFNVQAKQEGINNGLLGVVFTDEVISTDGVLNIELGGSNPWAPDNNPILSGLTLEEPRGCLLQAGDADMDCDFDQFDLVKVQAAAKYLTGQPATWGEGDWNGAPGGRCPAGPPPAGDGVFDQLDIMAALSGRAYKTGPYCAEAGFAAIEPGGDASVAVPEPSSWVLLVLGVLALRRRRRWHEQM